MGEREWKPGDVAIVNGAMAVRADRVWHTQEGILSDHNVAFVRPVLVINPGALQVPIKGGDKGYGASDLSRTLRLIAKGDCGGATYRAKIVLELADVIDGQSAPPKPDEPTGLGAVVRACCGCDSEVTSFVRNSHVDPNCPWEANCGWHQYGDLRSVEVLSEGVTP